MAEPVVQEKTVDREVVGDQVVERTTVENRTTGTGKSINKTIQIIYYLEGVLLALLALRFVLRLLGASQGSPFVNFIYQLTYPFVYPFLGMFRTQWGYGTARLEFETVIAVAAYAILFWIVAGLFRLGK
ncbi:MAG: YggT family protein [bacterium]|nr:YggT family protein [bacterium]